MDDHKVTLLLSCIPLNGSIEISAVQDPELV
jgi:hypothetical protein